MKNYTVSVCALVIALSFTLPLSASGQVGPPTPTKTVTCGQRAYIGHGAKYWYRHYYRIKHGKIRANVNLQKHPSRFRTKGCPRSIWRGHGPEYWHYRSAVITAKARVRNLAMEYQRSKPVRATRVAMKFVGTWYVWGGNHYPPGFDCSGLVQYAYSQVGFYLPRTTYVQRFIGRRVHTEFRESLQVGDILFFHAYGHEAMYIGRGLMIEAPYTGAKVRIVPVRPYIEARRVFEYSPHFLRSNA